MKTKDLIAELQKADPTGEIECCIDNADIWYLEPAPAYWDGCLQVLERDEKGRVKGGKYTSEGSKIFIKSYAIGTAIFDRDDFPVKFESEYAQSHYRERVERMRQEAKDIKNDVGRETFAQYAVKRFEGQIHNEDFTVEEIKAAAMDYYRFNMDYNDPMPEDILKSKEIMELSGQRREVIPSWNDRRYRQWDREIELYFDSGNIVFAKKG